MPHDPDKLNPDTMDPAYVREVIGFTSRHLMTRQEAADALRITPDTLSTWGNEGRGPRVIQISRRRMYARADVNEFIASNLQGKPAAYAAPAMTPPKASDPKRLAAFLAIAPAGSPFEAARDLALREGTSPEAFASLIEAVQVGMILDSGAVARGRA